ncbi:MAG: hypothetical protein KAR15_02465, partial [Desulfobacterales bacterium]|nr:hypothetical protein [Desulfobacterales bacterium]
ALMVNYSGHGATQIWAEEHILDTGDLSGLTNTAELPFFVSMSCETGFFAYPEVWFYPSLAEGLLRSDAGAVAALMPTGMTTTAGQRILNSALFEHIFSEDIRTLGPAIASAKQTLLANGAGYEQVSQTFLLFGDPAMELKVPIPRRPSGLVVEQQGPAAVALNWRAATDADGNAVAGYNVYRKTAADVGYSLINSRPVTAAGFSDANVTIGTRYYYVVRSVDADGTESVDSESVSIVLSAPATSLSGTSSGSGGGGGGACFISSAQKAFSRDIMRGVAIFGVIVILGLLLKGPRAHGARPKFDRGTRRRP